MLFCSLLSIVFVLIKVVPGWNQDHTEYVLCWVALGLQDILLHNYVSCLQSGLFSSSSSIQSRNDHAERRSIESFVIKH